MDRHQQKLRFSINPAFTDKTPPEDRWAFSQGFTLVDATIEELASVVSDDGWAFSYQFANDRRTINNFLATDIVAVDIDGGTTIEKTLANPLVKNHCSLFYTTPSHTPDWHRFRLVFILPRTITKARELTAVAKSLTRRLGGDPSATDAARMFYGCQGSEPLIFDKSISDELLDELIADGLVVPARDTNLNNHSTANRSRLSFSRDLLVTTHTGQQVEVSSIVTTTSVCCPFHPDSNPSAFVSLNSKGNTYLWCSKCQTTWWMKGSSPGTFNFYGFDQAVRALKESGIKKINPEDTPFHSGATQILIPPKNIHLSNSEFFELPKLNDGFTFIKSPKGSGKTTFLSEIVRRVVCPYPLLELYEEASGFDNDIPVMGETRILLIGHRQALIGDLCHRLHLNCYLDDKKFKTDEIINRQRRYGVCLDSLAKVRDQTYDIIVIDEVEQVLSHFMSETIGEQRTGLFQLFTRQIQMAKKVVALDADLGWVAFNTLTELTHPRSSPSPSSRHSKKKSPPKIPVHIFINDFKPANRSLLLYPTYDQLIQQLRDSVLAGKRIFVTSNSKEKIKILDKVIDKIANDTKITVNKIMITSENSRSPAIQEFITNIKSEILRYDVVLSSPSLGTGIDITFPDAEQEIDCVFGIFESRINSHFEVDQQLARVRHPKEVHVWISPQRFDFETEFNVVTNDYLYDHLIDVVHEGHIQDGTALTPGVIQPFYLLAAMITTNQRASKNNLKGNFINFKERQSWTVIPVPQDDDVAHDGKSLFNAGKIIKNQEDVEHTASARTLDQFEYLRFRQRVESNDGRIEAAEWYPFYHTKIELFYGQPVTPELVVLDDKGKFSAKVRQFERLRSPELIADPKIYTPSDINNELHRKIFQNKNIAAHLLYNLFSLTPIFEKGVFDPNVVFTKDALSKFVTESVKLRRLVETHLDISTQTDIDKKPTQHLGALLDAVGLKLSQPKKPTSKDGKKTYYYSVDRISLDRIQTIVERRIRQGTSGWDYVNTVHQFTYEPDQLDWMEDLLY